MAGNNMESSSPRLGVEKDAPVFDWPTLVVANKIANARTQKDKKFKQLVSEWKQQRNPYSSDPAEAATCPSYLKIIGMGPEAIPLVLNELRRHPDQWFLALNALTDENPILPEHCGNFKEMVNDWTNWGRRNGYILS
jgi:hypothetical protein